MIKKLTAAAKTVFSPERREHYIRAQEKMVGFTGLGRTREDYCKIKSVQTFKPTFVLFSAPA